MAKHYRIEKEPRFGFDIVVIGPGVYEVLAREERKQAKCYLPLLDAAYEAGSPKATTEATEDHGLAALAKELNMPVPQNCGEAEALFQEAARREEEKEEEDNEVVEDPHRAKCPWFNDPNRLDSWVRIKGEYHLLFDLPMERTGCPSSTIFPASVIMDSFTAEQVLRIPEYGSLSEALSGRGLPF
jgi:hypothetical protein